MTQVAIVTGSRGGIGRALVKTYLDDGYFVIGLDKEVRESSVSKNFFELHVNLGSFSKDLAYRESTLDKVKEGFPVEFSKLVLINNAATQILKPVKEIEWQDWEESFTVNAIAPFFLAQGFLSLLEKSDGHVINVSSIHAKLTKPQFACYAASKTALEAVTRSLAIELSPLGISVNAVAPAAISTEMLKASFNGEEQRLRELENYHPSKSIGTPEQLAGFIKAMTDQRSTFLTGAILEFNGGIASRLHDPS